MAEAIILYPSSGMGHLISMVELGKLILKHCPSFSITILVPSSPLSVAASHYIATVSAAFPSLSFHHLPPLSSPLSSFLQHPELFFEISRLNNPNLYHSLQSISRSSQIRALIIDFLNTSASEVTADLNIPLYYFFTSGASGLAALLYVPTVHQNVSESFKDIKDKPIYFPGLPPIPASSMADPLLDRSTKLYHIFIETATQMAKSKGIIVNTFESLESGAINAISDGLCVPNHSTPPIHCVGPLIATSENGGEHECMSWLNSQPSQSVVFLCFGSMGVLSAEQLMAMAVGLENSGHRFLWVVRNPPQNDTTHSVLALPEPNLDEILPKGFLERTKDKGLVVKKWAPQVAVLSHDSVGAFVTHCGWNSVLESVCGGVPMIAWPLYAEQKMNKVFLVEEMKVALALNQSESGLISSTELEERVRELMESETGKQVRDRVMAMRDGARKAMQNGGSSHSAMAELVESWKQA